MSLFLSVLHWTARLAALVVAGGFIFLVVGEFLSPHSRPPSSISEWTGIILLTVTCIGMLMAWRWEVAGAVISLVALVAYALMIRIGHHGVLFVLAAPGILFMVNGLLRHRHRTV